MNHIRLPKEILLPELARRDMQGTLMSTKIHRPEIF